MGKFTSVRPRVTGPVTTTGPALTHEGNTAYKRDERSELFMLAISNMVGEDSFYEKAGERDQRFRDLIGAVARTDPDWVAAFIPWLRTEAGMRSASVVAAAEYALARRAPGAAPATHTTRQVIDSALARPDEPCEFIAYWRSRAGIRSLPGGVQRGVADAITRLYNERAALKYDGVGSLWRQIDAVALAKPYPAGPWQADLFDYLADRRWNREQVRVTDRLPTLSAYRAAMVMSEKDRRAYFLADPERLRKAGMTWEQLSSLGPMDKAAWEAIIPSMGAMALVRNLRNFDEAGVSDAAAQRVIAKLTNLEDIRRSRQFPFRFYTAYRQVPSLRWGHALEIALRLSCVNIPSLPGRTAILVDTSASMQQPVSGKSVVRHVDVGALFGVALAAAGNDVTLCGFADGLFHHQLAAGGSVLKQTEAFCARVGEVGHGTQALEAVAAVLKAAPDTGSGAPLRRIVVVSDMQTMAARRGSWAYYPAVWGRAASNNQTLSDIVPAGINLFAWNTAGYANTQIDSTRTGRFELGGFSDKCFQVMALLDRGVSCGWHWEARAEG